MIRWFIEKLILVFKGRSSSVDPTVFSGYLLELALNKGLMLLRGLVKTHRACFVGRGSKIFAHQYLVCGKGVEFGEYSQIDCLGKTGLTVGDGSKIGAFSIVKVSGSLSSLGLGIRIGNNVGIGDFAHIGGAGGVTIGDDTITGSYLSIHPENHNFSDLNIPVRLQGVSRQGVTIGKNCWLGAKVTFLDGSSVGDGCVVAAGAVVNKVFGDNLIIGGVPARVIGERSDGDEDH